MSERLKCVVCGYVSLPDEERDKCPVCGAGEAKFISLPSLPVTVIIESADAGVEPQLEKLVRPRIFDPDFEDENYIETGFRCGSFQGRIIKIKPDESIEISEDNYSLIAIVEGEVLVSSDEGFDFSDIETADKEEEEKNEENQESEEKPEDKNVVINRGGIVMLPLKSKMNVSNVREEIAILMIING